MWVYVCMCVYVCVHVVFVLLPVFWMEVSGMLSCLYVCEWCRLIAVSCATWFRCMCLWMCVSMLCMC